jgi:hypothetical protein
MQLVDIKSRSGRILISVSLIWIFIATLLALNSGSSIRGLCFVGFMLNILIYNVPLIGFWLYRWIKQGKPSDEA